MKEKILRYLQHQCDNDDFSGSVLIAKDWDIILEFSHGYSNVKKAIKNNINTKYDLGSINKVFTAVAIAQLVEEKEISFNDFVGKFLPDYPNSVIKDQVTLHHLLTHTSGMGSFIDLKYRKEFLESKDKLENIKDVVELFENRPVEGLLNTYRYSSDGFELLGRIIEVVSQQNYYDYINENIYSRAEMHDTSSFRPDPNKLSDDIAVGYTNRDPRTDRMLDGERFENFGLNLLKGTAGGSGYSTCKDLLKFAKALLQYRLLSQEMTEKLLKPRIDLGKKDNQYKYQAYGFQVFEIDGVTRIGHPGRFAGVNTRLDIYPDLGFVVVVLSNYDPPAAFNAAEKIMESVLIKLSD